MPAGAVTLPPAAGDAATAGDAAAVEPPVLAAGDPFCIGGIFCKSAEMSSCDGSAALKMIGRRSGVS